MRIPSDSSGISVAGSLDVRHRAASPIEPFSIQGRQPQSILNQACIPLLTLLIHHDPHRPLTALIALLGCRLPGEKRTAGPPRQHRMLALSRKSTLSSPLHSPLSTAFPPFHPTFHDFNHSSLIADPCSRRTGTEEDCVRVSNGMNEDHGGTTRRNEGRREVLGTRTRTYDESSRVQRVNRRA